MDIQALLSVVLIGAFLVAAIPVINCLRILFADADLNLLSKGYVRENAFEGRVVWITGASTGIGRLLAAAFARLGARVILSSRDEARLQQARDDCTGPSTRDKVVVLPLDITGGPEAIRVAVEKAEAAFGGAGVDILVHGAAYRRDKMTALETSDEFLRATFELNVFGTIELTRQILPHMMERHRGRFVVVSSAAGKVASPTQAVYAASKHALQGYFHSLASELAGTGVGVTVVCPGPIASADQENASATDKESYSKDRMSCQRCVDLIIASAAHGVAESWISTQPVLGVLYAAQYFPRLATYLFKKIGPKRVAALKAGSKELYGSNLLFSSSRKED